MDRTDDVSWLSPAQLRSWMALVAMCETLPAALETQLKRDAGVTIFDYLVLAALSEAPDRTLRMSHLAALAQGSLSRLSHAVRRLEREGWVERHACPGDGRHTEARLTQAGWSKVVRTAPEHVREARRLVVDVLTAEELDQLGRIARKVLAQTAPETAHLLDAAGRERP